MNYLPKEIRETLHDQFQFPEVLLFGTIATSVPNVRTMRIYDFDSSGSPILLTHTDSLKWKEFIQNPKVAICIVSPDKLRQIIIRGELKLNHTSEEERNCYWKLVRTDVKHIYDSQYRIEAEYQHDLNSEAPEEAPATFGVASLIPSFWELLLLTQPYIHSKRVQFHISENEWISRRISVG